MKEQLCACGKPLHYSDPNNQRLIESFIKDCGPASALYRTARLASSGPARVCQATWIRGGKMSELENKFILKAEEVARLGAAKFMHKQITPEMAQVMSGYSQGLIFAAAQVLL